MAGLELRRTGGLSADSLFRRITGTGLLVLGVTLVGLMSLDGRFVMSGFNALILVLFHFLIWPE